MNEIVTVISTVGFPAAMCLLVLWYGRQELDKNREIADKQNQIMSQAIEVTRSCTDALNQNSRVMEKVLEHFARCDGNA